MAARSNCLISASGGVLGRGRGFAGPFEGADHVPGPMHTGVSGTAPIWGRSVDPAAGIGSKGSAAGGDGADAGAGAAADAGAGAGSASGGLAAELPGLLGLLFAFFSRRRTSER